MSYSPLTSKLFKFTALTVALALAGCGGDGTDTVAPPFDGGNNNGGQTGGGDNGQQPVDPSNNASEIFISTDKNQLLTGTDKTVVSIRVTDNNGGIVAGVPVVINIADAALYGLSLDGASEQVTDDKGLITVELSQSTLGVDSQLDHESLLTATVKDNATIKQTLPIIVSGTDAINVLSTKNVINTSESFRVTGQIVDGAAKPITNAAVDLYSNDQLAGSGRLDNNGNFIFNLTASDLIAVNNNYLFSIEVKGSEVNQRIPDILTVVSTTSSSLSFSETSDIIVGDRQKVTLNVPSAIDGETVVISTNKGEIFANSVTNQGNSRITATIINKKADFYIDSNVPGLAAINAVYKGDNKQTTLNFVSIEATKLLLQIERSIVNVGGSTSVIARVLDKNDAPVENAIVQFTTTNDSSGGSLSQGVAYTDSNGVATIAYNAGQNPTSVNGVTIRAQVQAVKLPDGSEKQVSIPLANSSVTVQTRSTFISFAFADKVSVDTSEIYYFRRGSVSVLNSTGKPAINQQVSINLNPDSYLKGFFSIFEGLSGNKSWNQNGVTCANEDSNNNGILDVGEDTNNNGRLDPINIAAVLNSNGQEVDPNQNFNFTTDQSGRVDFTIRYAKQYANWYRAKVTVNTRVDGSESQQDRVIDFPASSDDIDISESLRPNINSPFGTDLSCSSSR